MKKIVFIFVSFIVCLSTVFASTNKYNLNSINVTLELDDSYIVYVNSEDYKYDNNNYLQQTGVSKNQMTVYMTGLSAYLVALDSSRNKGLVITRRGDSVTDEYYDLNMLSDDIIDSLAEGYRIGCSADSYDIKSINGIKYLIFEYDNYTVSDEHLYYLKYKTIYNGYMYNIYFNKNSSFTDSDRKELENIVKKFNISNSNTEKVKNEKVVRADNKIGTFAFIISVVILIIVGILIFMKNRKRQKYRICKCGCKVLLRFDKCPKCGKELK